MGQQVHRQRPSPAGRHLERIQLSQDEAKARQTFDALVSRGDEVVDVTLGKVRGHRSEATHRVDEVDLAVLGDDLADGSDRVHDAGGRFAVRNRHMRDRRVGGELGVDVFGFDGLVLGILDRFDVNAQNLCDLHQAPAIRAVDGDQHLAARRNCRGDDRLQPERAGPLLEDAGVGGLVDFPEAHQAPTNVADGLDELHVARTEVSQHGLFDGAAGRQRAGREEDLVLPAGDVSWGRHRALPLLAAGPGR